MTKRTLNEIAKYITIYSLTYGASIDATRSDWFQFAFKLIGLLAFMVHVVIEEG